MSTRDGLHRRVVASHTFVALIVFGVALFVSAFVALDTTRANAATTDSTTTTTIAAVSGTTADATTPTTVATNEVSDELLTAGANVYQSNCSACHQPGGAGLSGSFPPLRNNPDVSDPEDAAFVRDVIKNGKSGPLTVLGVNYNGKMPAFSTLSDSEADAVIAYIQSGFKSPGGGEAAPTAAAAAAKLPAELLRGIIPALFVLIALLVTIWPGVTSASKRGELSWGEALSRSIVIVLVVVLFTVLIPSWFLQLKSVNEMSHPVRDVLGATLWMAGLAAVLYGLHRAYRRGRV